MRRSFIFLIAGLMTSTAAFAQPDSLWSRTYGGTGWDFGYSVRQTIDGGYVLGGQTNVGSTPSNYNGWLVKTNAQGITQWTRTFGGLSWDNGMCARLTSDSGYSVAGSTESYGGMSNFWLVKFNSAGTQLWSRTYGGAQNDWAHWGQQTPDGGFILAGSTMSYGAGDQDCWVVKTDANGNMVWNRTYGGPLVDDIVGNLALTTDGGYLAAAEAGSLGDPDCDWWLIKMNANGDSIWSRHYGGSLADRPFCVQQTHDGGYVVTGLTTRTNGITDAWLLKTDANGDSLWSYLYGGLNTPEVGLSVVETSDGGYVVVGGRERVGVPPAPSEAWMFKTDEDGDLLWNCDFGGPSYDQAYDVQQTPDGGFVVVGYTFSYGAGGADVWLVKTVPDPVLAAPQNLVVKPLGENVELRWNGVPGPGIQFSVYSDSIPDGAFTQLLGTTTDTSFVDTAADGKKFYVVRAVRP